MAKIPVLDAVRIIPRDASFLDRSTGNRGEVFFDKDSNSLRLYDGANTGGIALAKADLTNISNADFSAKAAAAGISSSPGGGSGLSFELLISADDSTVRPLASGNVLQFIGSGGIITSSDADNVITITNSQNNFGTISVSGQPSVTAASAESTLTLIAGANITLITDATSKSVQINATTDEGTITNSFSTIAVSGQSNIEANSSTDVLNIAAGAGITITTNASTDTITIANEATGTFSNLTDASAASMTVDEFYLPAITKLRIYNSGAVAYLTDQYPGNNPTIYAISGTTIAFQLDAAGHPFLIQDGTGNNYDAGLVHVSNSGVVSTEENAQGKSSGTLYWKIPSTISGGYRYQCASHAAMVGSIQVKSIISI